MRPSLMLPFIAVGVFLIAVSIPLIKRRIAPNSFYGLRVPATLADPWVWYEANVRTARDLVILGALTIVVALVLAPMRAFTDDEYAAGCGVVLGAGAILVAVIGWRRANRMLEARRQGQPPEAGAPTP
jgi:hypothetical protein